MQNEIHISSIFNFVVAVQDANGALNLSTATTKSLLIKKSDGTILDKTMTFDTDGIDGKLKYVTHSSDFDIAGLYEYQIFILTPEFRFYSDLGQFRVYPNLA